MLREIARRERWAILLWLAVLVVVSAHTLVSMRSHSVYHIFADAGRRWVGGVDLYDPDAAEPYRYSPIISACFAPFGFLPDNVGGILWRWGGAVVLFLGLVSCSRDVFHIESHQRGTFLLLVLPLAIGNLHNGQSNVLLLGLLLLAVAAAVRERWWLAGLCCAIACWLKVYPVALALLLMLIRPRRFTPWFVLFLAAGLLLPFLLQRPDYVADQYALWLRDLGEKDRHLFVRDQWYRDFRSLSELCGVPMSRLAYQILELLTAGGIALLTWGRHSCLPPRERLAFNLACCWMTLFGPATESATYILLAPTLAWFLAGGRGSCRAAFGRARHPGRARLLPSRPHACKRPCVDRKGEAPAEPPSCSARQEPRPPVCSALAWASYGLLLASHIAVWFPFGKEVQMWEVRPLAALLLLCGLLRGGLSAPRVGCTLSTSRQGVPCSTS